MSIRQEQLNLFDAFEATEAAAEMEIVRNYSRRLVDVKSYVSNLFERYEVDGKLHYDDMILYNRLEKMTQEVRGLTVNLYSENKKIITSTMNSGYHTGFTGQGEIISRAWGNQSLLGIIREEEIQRALNSEISGIRWAERMNLRREEAALKIRETIVQGLYNGETYRQMAERLNETVGKDVPNAIRIVRTETYRVFSEARKDRLDRIDGIQKTKEWITAKDEAVRGNHQPMHGVKVRYEQDFVLPNGNQGFGPTMIGDPKDDINCRCFYIVDVADDDFSGI